MKDMHPFADHIFAKFMEFDRSVVRSLPGIKSYLRYTPNGEWPGETLPWAMTLVNRTGQDGIRLKRQWNNGFIALPKDNDDDGPIAPLISAPFEGYVYIVKRRDEYKLGRTTNLRQRLSQLEETFKIEGLIHYVLTDNSKRLEKMIHRLFASVRTGGEWFRLDEAQLTFLRKLLCVFVDTPDSDLREYDDDSNMYPVSLGADRIIDLPLLDQGREDELQTFYRVQRYVPDGWPQDWCSHIPEGELANIPPDVLERLMNV